MEVEVSRKGRWEVSGEIGRGEGWWGGIEMRKLTQSVSRIIKFYLALV